MTRQIIINYLKTKIYSLIFGIYLFDKSNNLLVQIALSMYIKLFNFNTKKRNCLIFVITLNKLKRKKNTSVENYFNIYYSKYPTRIVKY